MVVKIKFAHSERVSVLCDYWGINFGLGIWFNQTFNYSKGVYASPELL